MLCPTDAEQRAEPETTNLSGLEALCDRIRAAGREVDLEVEEVDLSPTAERAAYRIVQEALTNAARHSAGGPIAVSVTRAQGDVVIEVRNTGTTTHSVVGVANGGGRGLVNMRERALLEGGSLEIGPGGRWLRRARQPPVARKEAMITVLLADDDVLVRQGLRNDVQVVGRFEKHAEALTHEDVVVGEQDGDHGFFSNSGRLARTTKPSPTGPDSRLPPSSSARSRMFTSPRPPPFATPTTESVAVPVLRTSITASRRRTGHRHCNRAAGAVTGCVRQCFLHDAVGGAFGGG